MPLVKLTPRMVPAPLWGVALRTDLGDRWLPEVSRPIRNHQRVCEVCGGDGRDSPHGWRLCCDEVWDYSSADAVFEEVLPLLAFGPGALPTVLPMIPDIARRVLQTSPLARLTDLQAVCWRCNAVIHYGLTEAQMDWPTRRIVMLHAERVNGVTTSTMLGEILRAKVQWAVRSAIEGWAITWDGWEAMRDRKAGRRPRRRLRTNGLDRAFNIGD